MEHGQVLEGRWRVDARVDAGGMGVVFRGTDLHDGTAVAIKALLGGDERERARFQREARALAELAHPAVVRYLDHGGTESPWLVMEWLEGETLATRLERTGLTPPEAIAVARRLALGLAAAHRAGIVHRDVKPRNVMLPGGDVAQAKLIDFGIVHVEGASVELTRAGGFIGTPAYVAPELARGHGETDARADLFALGCVLYECLTGRPAFAGGHVWAVLTRVLLEEPPPVSVIAAVPSEVDALVARLLAKDPARRPAGGDAVVAALDALPPFDGVRRVVPTAEEDLLSADELRVVAVVLVSTPASAWSDETLTDLADSAAGVAAPALPWAALEAIASERGARVERLLGGAAALVLEGAGAAHDHAAAAARCALAVHAAAPGTSVALAIGHARARAGSRATPAGEVIDRAAALLGKAGVYVDEVARGLVGAGFAVDGAHLLDENVAQGARPLLGRATPFVGRDRELGALAAILSGDEASCALVVGPAGAGKSRLVLELLARDSRVVWFARADAVAAGSALGLLGSLVRAAIGASDRDPPDVRRARLFATVDALVPPDDAPRVVRFLAELAGAPFAAGGDEPADRELAAARQDPRVMADQLRRAWDELVRGAASRAPLLVVLEDLHGADRASIELVDGALASCAALPLAVLATARSEIHEHVPDLFAARGIQEVRLGPLPRRAGERLVRAVLGDVAGEVVDWVLAHGDGTPLFLEELIRAVAVGTVPEIARGGETSTVRAMIAVRLQGLAHELRRVLRAAAVFGERFTSAGVAALLGDDPDLPRWLDVLTEREVLARAPGGALGFRHALIRDAAYAMLTTDDRRRGHRLAAAYLERTASADPRTLAVHLELGGERARAVPWWLRAAQLALEGDDYPGAIAAAGAGVAAGAAAATLGALHVVEVEAHRWTGEFAAVEVAAGAALAVLAPATASWCTAIQEAIRAAHRTGSGVRLRALATEVEAAARAAERESAPWTAPLLRTSYVTSDCLRRVGAVDDADRLLALADRGRAAVGDDAMVAAAAAYAHAMRARFVGDPAAALVSSEAAYAAYLRAGDRRRALALAIACGDALVRAGRAGEAVALLADAQREAERLRAPSMGAHARLNRGQAHHAVGALDDALAEVTAARDAALAQGNRDLGGFAHVYRAAILLDRADLAGALHELDAADALLAHAPAVHGYALGLRARALLERGDASAALAASATAMEILERTGLQEGEVEVRLAHIRALVATGDLIAAAAARDVALARVDAAAATFSEPAARARFLAIPVHAALRTVC